MKIGILTFHEVFNPGAFFQTLVLQMLLVTMGRDASLLNALPNAFLWTISLKHCPSAIGLISKTRIRIAFQ